MSGWTDEGNDVPVKEAEVSEEKDFNAIVT
jgi:hypothetical protein